jgi:hypothetical protein
MEVYKDNLYSEGRYYLGLSCFFLKFPINNKKIELYMPGRSLEGLKINIKSAVSFKLGTKTSNLELLSEYLNIYSNIAYNWNEFVKRISSQVIRDITSSFSIRDLLIFRNRLTNDIKNELSVKLAYRGFNLTSYYLFDIEMDSEFQNSLVQPEIVFQKAAEKNYLLQGLFIEAETNKTLANIQKEINEYKLNKKISSLNTVYSNRKNSENSFINNLYSNMLALKSQFNLKDKENSSAASQLLFYSWIKIISHLGNNYKGVLKANLPENLK